MVALRAAFLADPRRITPIISPRDAWRLVPAPLCVLNFQTPAAFIPKRQGDERFICCSAELIAGWQPAKAEKKSYRVSGALLK
jgi:hypothetical protein